MGWFKRWYGANPLHMLAMIGCFALAWYAGAGLLHAKPVGVAVWFAGAVVGHDVILMPLYALADKSVMTVFRHRPPKLPTVPWINYLRVPVVLSGMLLLIWFPLIFRIPSRFPRTTDLSLDPYLGHWLTVTGALFLLSAIALAVRLRPGRGGRAEAAKSPASLRTWPLVTPNRGATRTSRATRKGPAIPKSRLLTRNGLTTPDSPVIRSGRVTANGLPTPNRLPTLSRVSRNGRVIPSSRARRSSPVTRGSPVTRVTSRTQHRPRGARHRPRGSVASEPA
jgi:hypothetical protein